MKKLALIALAALATAHASPTRTATEGYVDRTVAAATNGLATAEDVESKADKATTLEGYGITNAATKIELDVVDQRAANALYNHEGNTNNPHKVTAEQVGAVALNARSTVGPLFSVQYTDTIGFGEVLSFGIGAGPGGNMFIIDKLYCPGHNKLFANGVVIVNEENVAGVSILARIVEQGGDFKTARAEVDNLIAASAATKADKATTLAGYGITNAATEAYVDDKVRKAVLPTDPTFSNAVLAVGLNIDTNSVAVLNEIAETFGGFPIEGTATTVGGLLAALAAAVAWLRKKKIDKLAVTVMSKEVTADGGVAKLDDFFTDSNSLLTATIDARLPYPLYAVTDETGLLKDRAINTTSLASVTVPDNFTDLLIRASVASSLAVSMPESITKYGDTFPGEAGEYLITITKTGAAEAYVRTIKLEVANA